MTNTIAVTSLGCDKNRVDTEKMLSILIKGGYTIISEHSQAEIIIVNTCAFIESARVEAIEAILECAEYKKTGKCKKLIVTGCLPQKHAAEIAKDLPEVDAFLGVKDYEQIVNVLIKSNDQSTLINRTDKGDSISRYLTTPPHLAYLRISDGCNNHCSYCTIPSIRGKYTSTPIELLVDETKFLIDSGAREIILVAQDSTSYGKDLYNGEIKLLSLLEKLAGLNLEQIRLMYAYPHLVSSDLLKFISDCNKMAKYMDCPIQHVDSRVLQLMNRPYGEKQVYELVDKIRSQKNYIALRTTLMVGFPTESDKEFNTLCDFVKTCRPDHIGVFEYSKENGTVAGGLKGQISNKVKKERYNTVGELHLKNSIAYNKLQTGKTLAVRYEGIDFDKNLFYGRSEYNAPDIDTLVYFSGEFADIGNMYNVKITDYENYDLVGELEK